MNDLLFNPDAYQIRSIELDGRTLVYRAYEELDYCTKPVDSIQKLNLFVNEEYFEKEGVVINGYTLQTAPIFIPNTVGGYLPGPMAWPGLDPWSGQPNAAFEALLHGYVVVCPGIRGRTTGKISKEFFEGSQFDENQKESKANGRAPALIVDLKAVIRYLRHNKENMFGDTNKIITSGTSAGGALSALAGTTGNVKDYEPYLQEIGAADAPDNIYIANIYCPIHNLEHADMAYEWQFGKEKDFHTIKLGVEHGQMKKTHLDGMLSEEQEELSDLLQSQFPGYVNSLRLKDKDGRLLLLHAQGKGSFLEDLKKELVKSYNHELETGESFTGLSGLARPEARIDEQDYFVLDENGKATDLDFDQFVKKQTRMKPVPAFDALDLSSPENEEFGDDKVEARHFTETSARFDPHHGPLADPEIIALMNPVSWIGKGDAARHFKIRHGTFDRDTSLAIPYILARSLEKDGQDVNFALPWGLPHSGSYDLPETFAWIDEQVRRDFPHQFTDEEKKED